MSDFLRHLVGRELGLEPGLRPRLPSLFETGAQRTPMAETLVERAVGDAATHSVTPLPRYAQGDAGPLPGRVPVQQEALPTTKQAERAPPPSLAPAPAGPAPDDRLASSSTSHSTREPSPSLPEAVRVSASPEPASVPPLRVRLAPTQASQEPMPAFTARTGEATDASRFATAPTTPKDTAAQATRPRTPSTHAPVQHADPAPTVVQVTIGRIEVRAAPAAASPPRQRDGPRPTALEDYLRDRNGRREA